MIPAQYDFELWKGSVYNFIVELPINLQSFSAAFVYILDGVQYEIPSTLVEVTTNPVAWEIRTKIPANVSEDFDTSLKIPYFLKVYNPLQLEDVYVYFQGKITPVWIL